MGLARSESLMNVGILSPTMNAPASPTAEPAFLALHRSGELARRAEVLWSMLGDCRICPRDCAVDRLRGEVAACFAAELPVVSTHLAHFGEEPCLTGTRGAGNIFFGLCNMRCVYCQNFQISQNYRTERRNEVSIDRLAEMMLSLQARGCHNINFVSPTHFVPQMVAGILRAADQGLRLPIVYNTNAYDSVQVLRLLEGIVDVYLPDLKYADDDTAGKYSHIRNYVPAARAAIAEMWRQVGPLQLGPDGIARRGMILRHLVLPNDLADSDDCLEWIRDTLGPQVHLSLMAQYYPTNKADRWILLNRKITLREYERVVNRALRLGFQNILTQEHHQASDYYRPDFEQEHAFHWGETAGDFPPAGEARA